MTEQTVEEGNAIILLTGRNDPIGFGHTTGYLEFYDERHPPAFPLESGPHHRLDGSPGGELTANLQEFSPGGTDNRFTSDVKEEVQRGRKRAIIPPFPFRREAPACS